MTPVRDGVPAARTAPRQADRTAEFDQLYQAHYGRVLAMAYALTGNAQEAQDLCQEAFCRAWQRWGRIESYDDPLAWVQKVVSNLASSRWRRLAVARLYARRQRATAVPPLEPDHVAVVTALRALPPAQRQVVVLHHLADQPVAEVARTLGVAEGTVKSWLHRGRAALAAQLGDQPAEVNGDE
jgi:RNA polymerase sigma-70 factor (ECF subfamily)